MPLRQAEPVLSPTLPPIAGLVRRHDPDRYYCSLFAPAERQPWLFALYAFNHELARAHEAAREPGLVLIRLQWWREVVEGAARAHEVALPLAAALAIGAFRRSDLLAMIEAREAEVEAAGTRAELRERLRRGAGTLMAAAGQALALDPAAAADDPEIDRLTALGAGAGLAGLVRNIRANARFGRCQIPQEVLDQHGTDAEGVIADPDGPAARAATLELATEARIILGTPQKLARRLVAAALPAVLARRDLGRPDLGQVPRDGRGIGDKLAVAAAAVRARV